MTYQWPTTRCWFLILKLYIRHCRSSHPLTLPRKVCWHQGHSLGLVPLFFFREISRVERPKDQFLAPCYFQSSCSPWARLFGVMPTIHNYTSHLLVAVRASFNASWPAFLTSTPGCPKMSSSFTSLGSSYLVPTTWTTVIKTILGTHFTSNFGVILDSNLCFDHQIKKWCFMDVRNTAKVKNIVRLILKWSSMTLFHPDLITATRCTWGLIIRPFPCPATRSTFCCKTANKLPVKYRVDLKSY